MNEVGYLKVQHPSTHTSVEGVFAAGDVADPDLPPGRLGGGRGLQGRDRRRAVARGPGDPWMIRTDDDPRHAPFLPILLYVLGFMGALALLALAAAWLLRRFG